MTHHPLTLAIWLSLRTGAFHFAYARRTGAED